MSLIFKFFNVNGLFKFIYLFYRHARRRFLWKWLFQICAKWLFYLYVYNLWIYNLWILNNSISNTRSTRFLETSDLVLTTYPQIRCHTQASGTAQLKMGCSKKMVAHEDFRRPQCDTRPDKGGFFNKFNFTLKDGQYDPDLVEYWIKTVSPE